MEFVFATFVPILFWYALTIIMEAAMNYLSYLSKHPRPYFALFTSAAMLIVLIGCTKDYGRFSRDSDLDQAFNKGEILQELNYSVL